MISIIVPIYNTEKYLENCINSICNQTYKDIEIILVDDGSTDNSGKICDTFSEQDNRITVIHTENKGISSARNTGIKQASGDCLSFVDSDDMIHPFMLEKLYNMLVNNALDISCCQYQNVTENSNHNITFIEQCNEQTIQDTEPVRIFSGQEMCYELYGKNFVNACIVWNKLYKRELFDDINFTVGKSHEDEDIVYKLFLKSDRIGCTDAILYYYLNRSDGVIGKEKSENIISDDFIEVIYNRYQFMKSAGLIELSLLSFRKYIGLCIRKYYSMPSITANDKNKKKKLHQRNKHIYLKEKKYLISKRNNKTTNNNLDYAISMKRIIYYDLFCRYPWILGKLLRIKNRYHKEGATYD